MSSHIARVAAALESATQKERLQAAAWIVLNEMNHAQGGMTEADHRLDVVTRHCGDILTQARGILGRYGNGGYPKK